MSDIGTLCVAAKCLIDGKTPAMVLGTDKRFESETTSTEVGFKFDKIQHENWVCVFAGNVVKARKLAAKYREALKGKTITLANFLQILAAPARVQRREYVDDFVQARHSVSYDEFLSGRDHFSKVTFHETEEQILQVNLECSLIIAGFLEEVFVDDQSKEEYSVFHPVICTIDAWGRADVHDHFVAIGSGAQNADVMLNYRKQHQSLPLVRTLYHVYEAKAFAESAPGVGKLTELAWVGSNHPYWRFMSASGLQYLKSILDSHEPKPTSDIIEQAMTFPYTCSWRDRERMRE